MARIEEVVLMNMCMIYNDSEVLVQEKVDDDYSGITFPGGHVEKGCSGKRSFGGDWVKDISSTIMWN